MCGGEKRDMQGILENSILTEKVVEQGERALGTKIGLFGKLFGCWHKRLTRPFTNKNVSYRACLECGARKSFDVQRFKSSGPFYYPPSVKPDSIRRGT